MRIVRRLRGILNAKAQARREARRGTERECVYMDFLYLSLLFTRP